mmetsp:Transcript_22018/g.37996  ORF Transcript_22018/g.37996 Transcript_22018/m.37996 type:complete len:359 (-) Transcript_22018:850-1926(-)
MAPNKSLAKHRCTRKHYGFKGEDQRSRKNLSMEQGEEFHEQIPHPQILADHGITLKRLIGCGGQACVYAGETAAKQHVAVKVIQKNHPTLPKAKQLHIQTNTEREIEVLKRLDHPRCQKYVDSFTDSENYYVVTEYIEGIDLYEHASCRLLLEDEMLRIVYQVLEALQYLHTELGIAHRDVKPENIMLTNKRKTPNMTDEYDVVLIDFGLAYFEDFDRQNFLVSETSGTVRFRCPEMIASSKFDPRAADIWAVGVIMYLLCANHYPFTSWNLWETNNQIMHKKEAYNDVIWKSVSRKTKKLVQALLIKDPVQRISVSNAMMHIESIIGGKVPERKISVLSNTKLRLSGKWKLSQILQV